MLAGGTVWAILGVGLAFGWIEGSNESYGAYFFAALVGWTTPHILAQTRRIAPFLVWLHVYSPRDWTPLISVPRSDDLLPRRIGLALAPLVAGGLVLGVWGLLAESVGLLRAGGGFLLAAATVHAIELGAVLSHAWRPDARWSSRTAAAPPRNGT